MPEKKKRFLGRMADFLFRRGASAKAPPVTAQVEQPTVADQTGAAAIAPEVKTPPPKPPKPQTTTAPAQQILPTAAPAPTLKSSSSKPADFKPTNYRAIDFNIGGKDVQIGGMASPSHKGQAPKYAVDFLTEQGYTKLIGLHDCAKDKKMG